MPISRREFLGCAAGASTAGVAGATLGTMFMHKKLNPATVKKILAVILLLMAAKLILKVF